MKCNKFYREPEDIQEWDYETRRLYWGLPIEVRRRFNRMMKRAAKRLRHGDDLPEI